MVMKTVGKTTKRATRTIAAVKTRAARTPMRRAAMRENMKTVMVKVMKRAIGMPLRAICVVRKA